jgi:hypothetical protein
VGSSRRLLHEVFSQMPATDEEKATRSRAGVLLSDMTDEDVRALVVVPGGHLFVYGPGTGFVCDANLSRPR